MESRDSQPYQSLSSSASNAANHSSNPETTVNITDIYTNSVNHNQRKIKVSLIFAATVLTYVGDFAWGWTNEKVGENITFINDYPALQYMTQTLAAGAAQTICTGITNEILARCKLTSSWGRWETAKSLIPGIFWSPFVDAGVGIGGGFSMAGNAYTPRRIVTSSLSLISSHTATLFSLHKLKQYVRGNTEAEVKKNLPSDLSEVAGSVGYYIQGPSPEMGPIGSPSGNRHWFWGPGYAAVAAGLAECGAQLWNRYRR